MKVRLLIKLIEDDGGYLVRTRGSHRQFKHPTKKGTVTVAGNLGQTSVPARSTAFSGKPDSDGEVNKTMEYVVIFEEGKNNCSAYVPDLPGCIAAGNTIAEVRTLIAEAIAFHIEGLREDGDVIPQPSSGSPIPIDLGMLAELRT